MKKRMISLLVVLSMISTFISIPSVSFAWTATGGSDASNNIEVIELLPNGSNAELGSGATITKYTAVFKFGNGLGSSVNQQDYFKFQLFSDNFIKEDIWDPEGEDPCEVSLISESIANDQYAAAYYEGTGSRASAMTKVIYDVQKLDDNNGGTYTFKVDFPVTNAVLESGKNTNLYIFFVCNGATTQSHQTLAIDKYGNPVVPGATVTFDYNGGKDGNDTSKEVKCIGAQLKTYTPEELATLAGVTPTKTGCKFIGWTTGSEGDTDLAADATAPALTGITNALAADDTVTVKAVWQEKEELPANAIAVKGTTTYTGSKIKPAIDANHFTVDTSLGIALSDIESVVSVGGDTAGQSAVATYTDNTVIKVKETSKYKKNDAYTAKGTWEITKADITTTIAKANAEYTGSPTSAATLTFNPTGKIAASDCEIKYNGRGTTTYAESTTAPTNVGTYTATVAITGTAANSYSLKAGTLSVDFEITPKTITANVAADKNTKVYGNTISDLADCMTFSDSKTKDDLAGIVFACDAAAATAGVGAKTVSITTQPTGGNYTVTMGNNKTITVTAKEITAALKAEKTKVFGQTGTLAADEFNLTGVVNSDNVAPTYTSNALAANAHVKDDYAITMTATNDNNYSAGAVTGVVKVEKANYTLEGTVEGTIGVTTDLENDGTTINVNATSDAKVKDALGNYVTGTIKITKAGVSAPHTAGSDISDCHWVFTPATDYDYKDDHNELSGDNASVTVSSKTPNTEVPTITPTQPTTAGGQGKITIAGTDGAAAEYSADGGNTWTPVTLTGGTQTIDVPAGSYIARYAETPTTLPGSSTAAAVVKNLYSVTIDSAITGGTVSADKTTAFEGDEVTLTISPATGNRLVPGSLTGATVDANNKFTMPAANVTISAQFEQIPATQYTIRVVTDPADGSYGIASASTAKAVAGDTVTIIAEPETGYEVESITGVTVDADNKFTMPAEDVTVTVKFKKSEYTITDGTTAPNGKLVFKDAAGNEIDPATAKLNTGDVVTVVVDPDDGYELDGALDAKDTTNGDAPVAIDANGNFTMPAGNVTVTAPAFKKSNYKVTPVNPTGDANGKFTVNTSTTQITAQKDDTITVDVSDVTSGYNVSVTATYTKTGETTTTSVPVTTVTAGTQYTFTMPAADVEVKVAFTKKPSGGGGGGVTSTYRVTYNPGKNGTIAKGVKTTESVASGSSPKAVPEITPNEGYTFKGWTIDGETIVVPTEEKIKKATTFTALYEEAAAATPTPVPTEEPDTGDHKLYIHGYAEDGSFRADNPVTRAEVATMFALALTDFTEGKTYENPYWDIDPNAWYADYILSLTELGAITGYDDSSFMPDQYITRQEFAAMLTRLGDVLPAEEMPFYDVSSENWGIDYIYTAYANGWVIGYEDGTFRPDRNISRTEAVKMVNGYLGRVVDATTVEGIDYNVFYDVPTNHWGYYEILEAANDHTYTVGTKPEKWVSVN